MRQNGAWDAHQSYGKDGLPTFDETYFISQMRSLTLLGNANLWEIQTSKIR